jgi:hypothetical protein
MPYFPPPSAGGSTVIVQDEGIGLGASTTLNFVGAGVTASGASPTTITIPSGGGSVAFTNATIAGVSYGIQYAEATVIDAAITATDKILVGWGQVAETEENTPDMDWVSFDAVPAAGSMVVRISTTDPLERLGGTYKIKYLRG